MIDRFKSFIHLYFAYWDLVDVIEKFKLSDTNIEFFNFLFDDDGKITIILGFKVDETTADKISDFIKNACFVKKINKRKTIIELSTVYQDDKLCVVYKEVQQKSKKVKI